VHCNGALHKQVAQGLQLVAVRQQRRALLLLFLLLLVLQLPLAGVLQACRRGRPFLLLLLPPTLTAACSKRQPKTLSCRGSACR
jgi:hypothetical protein